MAAPGELNVAQHRLAWVLGALLIVLLAVEGHRLAGFLPQAERAISELGPWGPLLYVTAILVLEPFLFPNFIFGVIAAAAASAEGTGLVFWLRLIPANPAILSYALGALRVLPRSVAIGTLGMAPHLFVDVYLGSAASHVTRMAGEAHANWESKGVGLLLGLVAVAVVSWRVARIARAQIRTAGVMRRPLEGGNP